MIKKFDNITIDCLCEDKEYIQLLENIQNKFKKINVFFGIDVLHKPVIIKLWDNVDSFRDNERIMFGRQKVANWLCGVARNLTDVFQIDTLILSELNKCESHEEETIVDLEKLITHEYVHICVSEIGECKVEWLDESFATFLSGQKPNKIGSCTMQDLIDDNNCEYSTYYALGNVICDNYSNEEICKMIKDERFLKLHIKDIFEKFKLYKV